MKMNIVYLHGLDSEVNCPKVQYLREQGYNVLNPKMDYRNKSCFYNTQHIIEEFNPDVIMGSSMGGWFAWLLGKYFEVPVVLLNPALHSRPFEPVVNKWGCELESKVYLVTGKEDDVIDPKRTVKWLNEWDKLDWNPNNHTIGNHGHRTPVNVLKEIFLKEKVPFLRENLAF